MADTIACLPLDRVRDLCLIEVCNDLITLHRPAAQLETLHIRGPDDFLDTTEMLAPFNGWRTPRLRTLVMENCNAWQASTFGRLRSLVIKKQIFNLASVKALFALPASNPSLEDLVIRDFLVLDEDNDVVQEHVRALPNVVMPKLQRVHITQTRLSDMASDHLPDIPLNPKIVPGADQWARCYVIRPYAVPHGFSSSFAAATLMPVKTLFIWIHPIVGTDARSAVCITTLGMLAREVSAVLWDVIPASKVLELRLTIYEESLLPSVKRMESVQKLVIVYSSAQWVEQVAALDLFPCLEELQIFVDSSQIHAEDDIFLFLKRRHDKGRSIRVLQFVHTTADYRDPTDENVILAQWQLTLSDFAQLVARASLSRVCTAPYPIDEFWDPWQ